MAVKPIPDGYATVTPYIYVRKSADALAFYEKAFGAKEIYRLTMPDGGIAHAEMRIGNATVMMADEYPDWGNKSPETLGGVSAGFAIYGEDCDAMFARAIEAGAKEFRPLADQFYGDRSGSVIDPFGHIWTLCTHKEDIPPGEMQARMDEWIKSQST